MARIAPSILSADFARLGEEIACVERGGAELVHVDVMDGRFVPNLTLGPDVVRAARRSTGLPLDVHLMVEEPDRWIEPFRDAGADWISVHVEAARHLDRTLSRIREVGAIPGVVVNPATPIELLRDAVHVAGYVLVMSVNPGFGGQSFLPRSLDRLRRLRELLAAEGRDRVTVEIDGGIGEANARAVVEAGAEVLVAGSSIFGRVDPDDPRSPVRRGRGPEEATRRLAAAAAGHPAE